MFSPNNRGGGYSHRQGGWMFRKKRNQPVLWTETGPAGTPGPIPSPGLCQSESRTKRTLPGASPGGYNAPLPATNAYLVLRTIDFHTREGMWGSKQVILSKKIFFLTEKLHEIKN